jgi:type IX secretion system substrate protein
MKFYMTLFLSLATLLIYAQSKHDYTWLMGLEPGGLDYPINCMNVLDFGDADGLKITKELVDTRFFVANASISDNDGNLLFYSNGCYVKDANHQIMPNGEHLNPGLIYDDNCPDGGYTAQGGIIILPLPDGSNKYYLFHQAYEVFNESPFVRINRLYFSTVDIQLNNGMGDVVQKNKQILSSQLHTGLQAVKHSNELDWWIITFSHTGNTYYKTLLSSNGEVTVDSQNIGNSLLSNGIGQMSFSPDGTKFAHFDFINQLSVFDFDRSTGLLSNYKHMEIDTPVLEPYGLAFSPSSRYLYLNTLERLYQLDMEAPDIFASKILVGEWDGFVYEFFNLLFPVYFERMQLGPDCKIYMTPHAPVPYLHVINNPDEPGLACDFVQRGIELPCSANYSIPNFPNYRLGTGYPVCDSNIVYVSSTYVPPPSRDGMKIYPNPATNHLLVELGKGLDEDGWIIMTNTLGVQVLSERVSEGTEAIPLDTAHLPAGTYFLTLQTSRGKQSRILVISR